MDPLHSKWLKKNNYDIILMDLVMPEMDGLETTRKIRKELQSPKNEIPILALTASVVKSEIDKCYAAGMNGFIPKPFKAHELFGAIYKALNSRGEIIFENAVVNNFQNKPKGIFVDLNYLYEFTEGDEVRIIKYIDLFLSKTPINIQNIKKAFEKNDYENIRITAHSMKPQLQAAGVKKGLELAESIEQSCREKTNPDQLNLLIENLEDVCLKAIAEMKVLCKELEIIF